MGHDASDAAERQRAVGRHYDEVLFDFERERLFTHNPAEYAITARYLERFVPPGAVVADVGVGVGHYAEHLAWRGCRLHLIDLSSRLLEATITRLRDAGLEGAVLDAVQASATDLAHLQAASCDAALMLGPLYHLWTPEERSRAVGEAARILRPGGLLYAAGVNRLAFLRDAFRKRPETGRERHAVRLACFESGQFGRDAFMSFSHLTTVEEFRHLFDVEFAALALVGVESFASAHSEILACLSPDDASAWLDLIERTGTTPEGFAYSDHFLYIGRRAL